MSASSRQNPPATVGDATYEMGVIATMIPVNVEIATLARFAAPSWTPLIEATWACVGATSFGSAQMSASATAMLPKLIVKSAIAQRSRT